MMFEASRSRGSQGPDGGCRARRHRCRNCGRNARPPRCVLRRQRIGQVLAMKACDCSSAVCRGHGVALSCLAATVAVLWAGVVAAADPRPGASQPQNGAARTISKFLEALKSFERGLRGNQVTAKLPVPPGQEDSDIVLGLQQRYLGYVRYGIRVNERYLLVQVVLLNRRDELVTVRAADIRLRIDDKSYPAGIVPSEYRSQAIETTEGRRILHTFRLASRLTAAPQRAVAGWVLFPGLPADERVPQMTLEVQVGKKVYRLDVTRYETQRLQLRTELLGPREAIGVLRIAGELNTVNVGALADAMQRLVDGGTRRLVVSFAPSASPLTSQLRNWLMNVIQRSRRGPTQTRVINGLPPGPAGLGPVAAANVPGFTVGAEFASANQWAFRSEAEAVTAVAYDLFDYVPTAELRRMVQRADPRLRAAVVWALGRRSEPGDLDLFLQLAKDPEQAVRWAAVRGLAWFDDQRAAELLVSRTVRGIDAESRVAALAIAESPHPRFSQRLLQAVRGGAGRATSPAVLIVAQRLRTREWADVLFEALQKVPKDPPPEALSVLVAVGHPRLPELVDLLLERGTPLLHRTMFSLFRSQRSAEGDRMALKVLKHYLRSHAPDSVMVSFLATVHDQEAIDLMLARLEGELNKTTSNRGQLVALLLQIGDQRLTGIVRRHYEKLRPYERGTVLMVMRQFDSELFYEYAERALRNEDRSLVNMAVQALRYDGSDRAVELLYAALKRELAKTQSESGRRTSSASLSYLISGIGSIGDARARRVLSEIAPVVPANLRAYVATLLRSLRQQSPAAFFLAQALEAKRKKQWSKAEVLYRLAEQADPDLSEVYLSRGEFRLLRDDLESAERDFRKAGELDPHNGHVVTGLAIIAVRKGRVEEGLKRLETAVPRYDEDAVFLYNAACVYSRACEAAVAGGREDAARRYADRALRFLSDSVRRGFGDLDWAKEDPDLAALRRFDAVAFRRALGEQTPEKPSPK
ncbi:MAG: hypothetical protein D6725_13100 [Planctomycetota bacterium]|nr:MAG: hypothetical protein D6725_13100 [Planctomycetota bacterium]